MGEAESAPPLVGVKVLPLIPLGSRGYVAATVWNGHGESGEGHPLTTGPGWPTRGDGGQGATRSAAISSHHEELQ